MAAENKKADLKIKKQIRVVKMRIKCYCNLYVSDALEKRKNKVLADLMNRKFRPGTSVITLSQGEQNHLEFFSSVFLKQHFYDEKEVFVVGIAGGYEDAAELVRKITEEVLVQTGSTDIRNYILENQKKSEESRV